MCTLALGVPPQARVGGSAYPGRFPGSRLFLAAVLVGTQVTYSKVGSSFKELSSAGLAMF